MVEARAIKLHRRELTDAANCRANGFRLRAEVAEVHGGMDPNVFLYEQSFTDAGDPINVFQGVISFPDIAEYPAGSPNLANNPFFRLDYVELDFLSGAEMETAWKLLLTQVCTLVSVLNIADDLVVTEETWCGAGGVASESESAGEALPFFPPPSPGISTHPVRATGGGPCNFSVFVIAPGNYAAGHFAVYNAKTGQLQDSGFAAGTNPGDVPVLDQNGQLPSTVFPPTSGGDRSFQFNQAVPASTWLIVHNLGKVPSISVYDSANDLCEGDVIIVDLNTIQVSFGVPFSGTAYCN